MIIQRVKGDKENLENPVVLNQSKHEGRAKLKSFEREKQPRIYHLQARLPQSHGAVIDKLAEMQRISRSEVARRLLSTAIEEVFNAKAH